MRAARKVMEDALAGMRYGRPPRDRRDMDPTAVCDPCVDIGIVSATGTRDAARVDPLLCPVRFELDSICRR